MNITQQRHLRIVTPGAVVLVLLLLTGVESNDSLKKIVGADVSLNKLSLPLVLSLVIGYLHHQFVRPYLMNPIWQTIDVNIKRQMIVAAGLPAEQGVALLSSNKGILRTFYTIIDSNQTLRNSSDKVRFNGYVLTTVVDVQIFFYVFAILNSFLLVFAPFHGFRLIMFVLLVALLSPLEALIKYLKNVHTDLGNSQMKEILMHHRAEFDRRMNEYLVPGV